ncbi:MAG TPA: GntR family transcriptional regulator [Candidatus Mediterraneibacter pullistercoris]|nr:GntR family transcriptional regulator [Candidatus Mediterraneibacter pullistercoris]
MANKSNGAIGKAYQYLREGILSGDLPLGSPISEMEISAKLQISRSPIREALRRMETEGLVYRYPGRGTFVTNITRKDLEEIFELRIMFEVQALNTASRYFDDKFLEALERDFADLNPDSQPQQYYDANTRLHRGIIAYAGNKRMEKFYKQLQTQIAIVTRISARDPEHFVLSRERHLAIVRALKERDVEKAKACLTIHLEEVRDRTIKGYSQPVPLKREVH